MINNNILAIVTLKEEKEKVRGGGSPIFYGEDEEEVEYLSMLIARITDSMVHDLGNGINILVKH